MRFVPTGYTLQLDLGESFVLSVLFSEAYWKLTAEGQEIVYNYITSHGFRRGMNRIEERVETVFDSFCSRVEKYFR